MNRYLYRLGILFSVFSACVSAEAKQKSRNVPATPVKLIRSDFADGEITKLCDEAMKKTDTRLNALGQMPAKDRTVQNSLLALEEILDDLSDDVTPLTFMSYVSRNEKLRAEGATCEAKAGEYNVSIFARRDLYHALDNLKPKNKNEARLLLKTLEGFRDSGAMLSDPDLEIVTKLNKRLAVLSSQFAANLNNDTSSVEFTLADLEGVPQASLDRLKKSDDGKYVVPAKENDYVTVMQSAKNPDSRKKMMLAFLGRGGEKNSKILEEAIQVRYEIAKIMGFDTWADFRIHPKMAKNKKTVLDFLNGLKEKLSLKNQADQQQLLRFKKESIPSATTLDSWDIGYYTYQLQKRDYTLDNEKIREYFPAETVVKGLFHVYETMLGIEILPVRDGKTWSDDVKLYEIRNRGGRAPIAYFYTDFVPRNGKYGHAAAFNLIGGRTLKNGVYSIPVSSIVANFTPPSGDKPSLLIHDEVETIFHEFGHIMHQTLTRAPYASLSGSNVAGDFVEAPSQMLENWVWSPQILAELSGNYQRPAEKLPKDILERLISARFFQKGVFYTKQLLYGLFDMTIHTQTPPVDTRAVYAKLHKDIMGYEPLAGSNFPAGFGHLMGGYDAGYYGYLWSQVYSEDMLTKFPATNLMDEAAGDRYRKIILERGNMEEAIDLLRKFLGHEPSMTPFFKKLGIN